MFKALWINKDENGYTTVVKDLEDSALPEGDVTVDVEFSGMNYKDALAITGKGPVVRKFPMVPGIDLVGKVQASTHPELAVGDRVVLNGWGVGETHWGGLSQRACLTGDWLVPLPPELTARQAAAIGTAGYTAMLCVMALQDHGVEPGSGEVLVTGAAGGVGSVAVAILSGLGYDVVAMTGRPSEEDYLKSLGAKEIMDRSAYAQAGKPLAKERWAGVIDVVGGHTLANACAATRYGGTVAACGLAGGMDFPSTVAPFILRGVTLAGVDSVMCPRARRLQAWGRLGKELDLTKLESMVSEVTLPDCIDLADNLLAGQVRGRVVVNVSK